MSHRDFSQWSGDEPDPNEYDSRCEACGFPFERCICPDDEPDPHQLCAVEPCDACQDWCPGECGETRKGCKCDERRGSDFDGCGFAVVVGR